MKKFKEVFDSPYEQYIDKVGQKFKVLRNLTDEERDPEVGTMYEIQFEDGTIIEAWPEEVEDMIKTEYGGGGHIEYKERE